MTRARWCSGRRTASRTTWSPPPARWRWSAAGAWASSTPPPASGRSATSSATRCRPGRSRWSPTPGRCSRRCCAPDAPLGYSVAVSSGQELVTTTADYLEYALSLPETRVVGLVLETMRDAPRLGRRLAEAAARDIPVCALTVGHLGPRAGAGRRTLRRDRRLGRGLGGAVRGVRRAPLQRPRRAHRQPRDVRDRTAARPRHGARDRDGARLRSRAGAGRRRRRAARRAVRDARRSRRVARLAALLDPGLEPMNPLDVWGRGSRHRRAVHRVPERAGRRPRRPARWRWRSTWSRSTTATRASPVVLEDLLRRTDKPVAVLSNITVGRSTRRRGRAAAGAGHPGARGHGVRAARARAPAGRAAAAPARGGRRRRACDALGVGSAPAGDARDGRVVGAAGRLRHPGRARPSVVSAPTAAVAAAERLGYPVVLKSDAAGGAPQDRGGRRTARARPTPTAVARGVRRPRRAARPAGRGAAPGVRGRGRARGRRATRCSGRW